MSAKASPAARTPSSGAEPAERETDVRTPERPVQRPTASERPIDRFARLVADVRRTHPLTALMLSTEYIRCARADREAWLAAYVEKLEAEWRA
jgi:hypothetical protein